MWIGGGLVVDLNVDGRWIGFEFVVGLYFNVLCGVGGFAYEWNVDCCWVCAVFVCCWGVDL